jgi:hypothetical protein
VAIVEAVQICPSCAAREVDTPSGICAVCAVERAASNYALEDRRRAIERNAAWGFRAALVISPKVAPDRLRKERQRLLERTRPREPARSSDPLVIAEAGLSALAAVRQRIHKSAKTDPTGEIEIIAEAIRRLAWGPDD